MPEPSDIGLIRGALWVMRDETLFTAYAELGLQALEKVAEALRAYEAEVEQLKKMIEAVSVKRDES